ncbi:ComEC/Rec2 family competence protein [Yoonia sp. R2331]|uniref:ComEC/Rec2 family competence protein n=1 Tax=Yoonia sp. R2331 TaxID=3237238 RepID=UPI0034E3BBC2
MQLLTQMVDAALAQRGNLIGWVPVCLGIGIAGYFSLRVEPELVVWAWVAGAACGALLLARLIPYAAQPLAIGLALVLCGAMLAKWQAVAVDAPILTFRYYGPIEGRVVNIDRSASDAPRLTLDQVRLDRIAPDRMPTRVRISVHGDQPLTQYQPGEVLMTTGHLSPPSGPAEPGGFDFQRHAYFDGLGAVGYTRNPVLRAAPVSPGSWRHWIFAKRMAISTAVQQAMPGETGAFAAAIMTGDRSAMGQSTLQDLRASNLAHLLAISGLHMGLLTGFVFAALRYGLALWPRAALRWPVKKIAAVCALIVGAFYLALSGGNVATERAYIMVSVMFVAILLDRRALTLRAVAMAAILVLVLHPEALLGPGFQMSFAATTALVVVFGQMRHLDLQRLPKWTRPVLSVVISSFVAGLATAPIAAAHFNQIAHYGLIANLLSVPLMGTLVMPAAVLAVCLAPFGLWGIGLWLMELGLRWILWVARTVAAQDGALSHVPSPAGYVLGILTLGLLWSVLWHGRARWAGSVVAGLALLLWTQTQRPQLLIADNGALIGMMTPQGRALSRGKGSGFVAGIWLENDGQPVDQANAASRPGLDVQGRVVRAALGDWEVLQVSGKTALAELQGCGGADILISNQSEVTDRPCLVLDARQLRQHGAIAASLDAEGALVLTTARDVTGTRPWNAHAARGGVPDLNAAIAKGPQTAAPLSRIALGQ